MFINAGFVFNKNRCVYISTTLLCLNKHKQCYVFYYVVIVGRFAHQYKYVVKYIALLVFPLTQGLVFL